MTESQFYDRIRDLCMEFTADRDEQRDKALLDGAELVDALLDCTSSDECHDLVVNHTAEFKDMVARLRNAG